MSHNKIKEIISYMGAPKIIHSNKLNQESEKLAKWKL